MRIYKITGILDGWKIISEEVKARTDKEAKSRIRRRYKRIQSLNIVGVRNGI